MNASGNQLLAALGSGILPGGFSPDQRKLNPNELSFDEILQRVRTGQPSGVAVQLGEGIGIDQIRSDQLDRVGHAADIASKSGISNVAVDLGASIVRLDVKNRVIEAQMTHENQLLIDQVDGLVIMHGTKTDLDEVSDQAESSTPVNPLIPARVVRNTSLADVLSARSD